MSEALGFDVLGAFAGRVAGAAPELAVGLAGGAAAHGFSAEGTERGAGLFGAGLDSGGVEALGEAAVFFLKKNVWHLFRVSRS